MDAGTTCSCTSKGETMPTETSAPPDRLTIRLFVLLDKRPHQGAASVCFACRPKDNSSVDALNSALHEHDWEVRRSRLLLCCSKHLWGTRRSRIRTHHVLPGRF